MSKDAGKLKLGKEQERGTCLFFFQPIPIIFSPFLRFV